MPLSVTHTTTADMDESSRQQVSALLAELRHREKIASNIEIWLEAVSEFRKMKFSEDPDELRDFISIVSELKKYGDKFLRHPAISDICVMADTTVDTIQACTNFLEITRDAADYKNNPELVAEFAKLDATLNK